MSSKIISLYEGAELIIVSRWLVILSLDDMLERVEEALTEIVKGTACKRQRFRPLTERSAD